MSTNNQAVNPNLLIEKMRFKAVNPPETVDCVWAFSTLIDLWWFESDKKRFAGIQIHHRSSVVYHINVDARAINGMPENPYVKSMFPVEIDIHGHVFGVAKSLRLCRCFIVMLRTVVTTPDIVL